MNDATYQVEITYDPHSQTLPWDARIFRLSTGRYVTMVSASTRAEAESKAREWIKSENEADRTPVLLYVDDEGRDAAMHSVKA